MELFNSLKKQVTNKIQENIPENMRPYLESAEDLVHDLSDRKVQKTVELAQTKFILPSDVEKDILSGISYAKCKKKLCSKRGFEDLDSKELDIIISTAGTRICAERDAQQFEKDFNYYKISPCPDACPACSKLSKEVFQFKKRKIGVNFPPLHKGCRCSIITEVKDWNKWMVDYEKKNKKK